MKRKYNVTLSGLDHHFGSLLLSLMKTGLFFNLFQTMAPPLVAMIHSLKICGLQDYSFIYIDSKWS